MYVFVSQLNILILILCLSNGRTKCRNRYSHHKKITIYLLRPGRGEEFYFVSPTTRMYKVVHTLFSRSRLDLSQHKCGVHRIYYSDDSQIKWLGILDVFNYFQYFNKCIVINCKNSISNNQTYKHYYFKASKQKLNKYYAYCKTNIPCWSLLEQK